MRYSRVGLYTEKNINKRLNINEPKKKIDVVSVVLFIVLIIIVLLFIFN